MTKNSARSRRQGGLRHAAALAGAITAVGLLAAGCGGSGHPGATSTPGSDSGQKIAKFTACMHSHGVPNLNVSQQPAYHQKVLVFGDYSVTGVDPQSAQVNSAMQTCQHFLGVISQSPSLTHREYVHTLRSSACMRSHGYPTWPDPTIGPYGGIKLPTAPPGVDTSTPQFQKAAKTCGASVPPAGTSPGA